MARFITARRRAKLDKLTGAPLFWAAEQKRLLLHFQRDRAAPMPTDLAAETMPVVLVITDDGDHATGPDGWACAAEVRGWLASGYPFANAMDRQVYEAIVEEAIEHRRFVLVETIGPLVNAWRLWLGGRPERPKMV